MNNFCLKSIIIEVNKNRIKICLIKKKIIDGKTCDSKKVFFKIVYVIKYNKKKGNRRVYNTNMINTIESRFLKYIYLYNRSCIMNKNNLYQYDINCVKRL